jgi:type VI secretion system protein ImpC
MTKVSSSERAEIGLTASMEESERVRPDPDSPFRILLMGDFSGRSSRGVEDPESLGFDRLPIRVDRDNLEEVMEDLAVELRLRLHSDASPAITLRAREIDDLHPDRIYEKAAAFSGLRRLREKLDDPASYEDAAAEVRSWFSPRAGLPPPQPPNTPPEEAAGRTTSENLVSELLESAAAAREKASSSANFDAFVQQVVQPHLAPAERRERAENVAAVEASVASWMRTILRDPDFQALEAAWRGLDFLVRRLETDGKLQVFVLDVTKTELAAALRSAEDLETSAPYRILVSETVETPGAKRWSALAGLYTFDQSLEDVAMLGRLARTAHAAGAPFVAAASPHIAACESLSETPDPDGWRRVDATGAELWQALRELPESAFLGLALPRFLLRLPYGKDTDAIERFAFEEFGETYGHEDYLWGNPALACVCLLGQEFSESGWQLDPGARRDVENLPLHTRREDGRAINQPCAEVILSDRAAQRILDAGLMPLVSMRDHDKIRLVRFQSIADPPTALSGPWQAGG